MKDNDSDLTTDEFRNLPTVSVIVPAYNAENNIANLIESLLDLDYPQELLELIMVDNNSTDRTKEIIKKYPVKLLEENSIQSSYAARNKGIKHARGEIIAFTDSDCIATKQWVREGVNALVSENADLVAGKVEFIFSKKKTAAEFFDSITNLQTESYVKEGFATTANLFVSSSVFRKIGVFPEKTKSGGDTQWTLRATKNGYSLIYAPKAIVKHPARPLMLLFKKKYRVGKGLPHIWLEEGKEFWNLSFTLKRFIPPRFSTVKRNKYSRLPENTDKSFFSIWLISYFCDISTGLGVLASYLTELKNRFLK
ncbi:MAG: glycosyltransferase [Halobacteriota archaeon]